VVDEIDVTRSLLKLELTGDSENQIIVPNICTGKSRCMKVVPGVNKRSSPMLPAEFVVVRFRTALVLHADR